MNEELEKQVNEAMENEFDGCDTFDIVRELLGLRQKIDSLQNDIIRFNDICVKKTRGLQAKLTTAVEALKKIALIGNKHVRPDSVCACNICIARLTISEALTAIRKEGKI